jgi:hypothetical protein
LRLNLEKIALDHDISWQKGRRISVVGMFFMQSFSVFEADFTGMA